MNKSIPITVLTGYLGSGKTTLVNHILAEPKGRRIAVIVNDIGEVNIDAELISSKGHATLEDNSLVALQNGCICCTLRTDLIEQIAQIADDGSFDYILIEASGICEPVPIAQTIITIDKAFENRNEQSICRLDAIVAVVDAFRLLTEFSGGEALLNAEDDEDIAQLLIQQIEFCNLVLLNKTDLLSEDELAKVEAIIKILQPTAKIVRTSYVDIPTDEVLDAKLFDFEKTFLSAGWAQAIEEEHDEEHEEHSHDHDHHHDHHHDHDHHHGHDHHHEHDHEHDHHHHDHDHEHGHEHCHHHDHDHSEGHSHIEEFGISTFVYYRRKPFDVDKLEAWLQEFPAQVIRCKGLVWLESEPQYCFILEQAGQHVSVEPYAMWLAAATPEEREQAWQNDPLAKNNWDEQYGDRMTKLVFIGIDMDEEEICNSLDTCLL